MKRIFNIITLVTALFVTSCVKDENVIKEADYDFKTNYEAFWNLFNEKYCFMGENFGYSKNVDWDAVYDEMMPKVEAAQTEEELLEIMGLSIDKLKDGHIWIDTKFNHRGCYTFYYDENGVRYPENSGTFDKHVKTSGYSITGGFLFLRISITFLHHLHSRWYSLDNEILAEARMKSALQKK